MKRFNRKFCVVGGCIVALLTLGSFAYLYATNANREKGIRAAAYANLDPTGCTESCPIIDRSQMGIAALKNLAAH